MKTNEEAVWGIIKNIFLMLDTSSFQKKKRLKLILV